MTGEDWPPLIPDPPGQEGKLPAIVPKVPCSSKNVALKKVVTMEAGSLNSACSVRAHLKTQARSPLWSQ